MYNGKTGHVGFRMGIFVRSLALKRIAIHVADLLVGRQLQYYKITLLAQLKRSQ